MTETVMRNWLEQPRTEDDCQCSTCLDGMTCASFVQEVKTGDSRGLAHRRYHRGPMAIDKFVNAASKIRESAFWARVPGSDEVRGLVVGHEPSDTASGEIKTKETL